MYLITRPINQAKILIEELIKNGIEAKHVPILEIKSHDLDIGLIQNLLTRSDSVLFISPTAVDLWNSLNLELNGRITIATGEATAKNITTTNNIKCVFPLGDSGVRALIKEEILQNTGKLLIVGGGKIHPLLEKYLLKQGCHYDYISLYERINHLELNPLLLDAYLQIDVAGLVVTSSLVAKSLVKYAEKDITCLKWLNTINLISIHDNITKILKKSFSRIIQTKSANNSDIINLIKELR